jgi:hypothetical protein
LQRSDRYAAAITSSGNHDLSWMALLPEGPAWDTSKNWFNATSIIPTPGDVTYQLSWSQMPQKLRTPLLVNSGQGEVLFGFEGTAALKDARRPVEWRIFPDTGGHMKFDPEMRAGVYENNMMWLRFWLQGEQDTRPEFRDQYSRWEAMRRRLQDEGSAPLVK